MASSAAGIVIPSFTRRSPRAIVVPRTLDARADQRLHRFGEPVDAQMEHREETAARRRVV